MNTPDPLPDYSRCSLFELIQILNAIVPDRAPAAHAALWAEIEARTPQHAQEAQSCWNRLDQARFPELANRLARQFNELEKARLEELANIHGTDPSGKPLPPPYRTFGRRFFATIIDMVVLFIVELPLFYLLGADTTTAAGISNPPYFWTLALTRMIYIVGMHSGFGWTLGKRVMKLQVVDAHSENRIGFVQSLARHLDDFIGAALWLPFLLLMPMRLADLTASTSYLTLLGVFGGVYGLAALIWYVADTLIAFTDEKHRALHDRIGRTLVRRIPPKG